MRLPLARYRSAAAPILVSTGTTTRPRVACLAALVMLVGSGCSTLSEVSAGPTVALGNATESASPGVAFDLRQGLGGASSEGERVSQFGLDVGLKGKVTSRSQSLSFGDGFYWSRSFGKGIGLVRGGAMLGLERYDDRALLDIGLYGGFSGGYAIAERNHTDRSFFGGERRERTYLTFGPTVDLSARFSRPSGIAFLGLSIGLVFTDELLPYRRDEGDPAPVFAPKPPVPPRPAPSSPAPNPEIRL